MKAFLHLLLILPIFSFAQVESGGFTINGSLPGVADGTDVHLYVDGQNEELASAKMSKGAYVLKGKVFDPVLCYVVIGSGGTIEVYVENKHITVAPDKARPGKYLVTGSVTHADFVEFANAFTPLVQQLNSLATTINSMGPGPERDGLMNNYNGVQQKIQQEIDNYIQKKPKSPVSVFVLRVTSSFYDDPLLLESRFNKLDKSIRKSPEAMQLAQNIAVRKVGAVGTQALDFVQPDTLGQPVSLSSFHGKYVLVDFWASWCGPCRNENPNVVQNYHRFQDKNFTVLGVSLDRPGQKANWMQAIKKDSLTWSHVSDLQFWDNAAAKMYHINQIPQNLLLDPEGKIIAKNLRGPALSAKLCEIFGCSN